MIFTALQGDNPAFCFRDLVFLPLLRNVAPYKHFPLIVDCSHGGRSGGNIRNIAHILRDFGISVFHGAQIHGLPIRRPPQNSIGGQLHLSQLTLIWVKGIVVIIHVISKKVTGSIFGQYHRALIPCLDFPDVVQLLHVGWNLCLPLPAIAPGKKLSLIVQRQNMIVSGNKVYNLSHVGRNIFYINFTGDPGFPPDKQLAIRRRPNRKGGAGGYH